jgi:hypothetical protein
MLVMGAVFIGLIVSLVFGVMKSSDVYKGAVGAAQGNAEVVQALGSPLKEGLFVSGNINVSGSSGQADLSIPVSGPKGKAVIYAVATKSEGKWTYSTLEVEIGSSGQRINLRK